MYLTYLNLFILFSTCIVSLVSLLLYNISYSCFFSDCCPKTEYPVKEKFGVLFTISVIILFNSILSYTFTISRVFAYSNKFF